MNSIQEILCKIGIHSWKLEVGTVNGYIPGFVVTTHKYYVCRRCGKHYGNNVRDS